jgi:hypothetical protein
MEQDDIVQAQRERINELEKLLLQSEQSIKREEHISSRAEQEKKRVQATLLSLQAQLREAGMGTTWSLEDARLAAGLPWAVELTYVSYERLRKDPLFRSNIKAMTGFSSLDTLDAFFDVCIGFSGGVLPLRYSPPSVRAPHTQQSTKSLDFHKNVMFFILYVIRTGSPSFALAGMLFGFERDTATRWYVAWAMAVAFCLARLFPQPDLELIQKTSPPKFKRLYNSRLVGIIDCTECKMQTPSEKMAQRATWSDYKSNNTVKYLVVISPAGATVYVSPAFPGRISDPQICHACATYADLFDDMDAIVEEQANDVDEFMPLF